MVVIAFTSSVFSGLELSAVLSATVTIAGGFTSSININIPVTFTAGTATG